jgi:hypothetical protein
MRINVYSQELITDPGEGFDDCPDYELDTKTSNTGLRYSAVRMFLHSSDRLHSPPDDDDRSAITFWLPKSDERRNYLAEVFEEMASLIRLAPSTTGLD